MRKDQREETHDGFDLSYELHDELIRNYEWLRKELEHKGAMLPFEHAVSLKTLREKLIRGGIAEVQLPLPKHWIEASQPTETLV